MDNENSACFFNKIGLKYICFWYKEQNLDGSLKKSYLSLIAAGVLAMAGLIPGL
jgi:hypothetical protein